MAHDIPPVFEGTVEIDETYVGGNWRDKRKTVRAKRAKRGRGTAKYAVFGILCRNGQVWAEWFLTWKLILYYRYSESGWLPEP